MLGGARPRALDVMHCIEPRYPAPGCVVVVMRNGSLLQWLSDVTRMSSGPPALCYACAQVLLTDQDKADAIRRVTGSVAFHRADLLKALLEYLHAQESAGRAHEVTETEIAMKVMGRGPGFAPESDSSVRTRFLALRKKLDEYYAGEGRETAVRLDVPRGTYTLRFLANAPPVTPSPAPVEAPVPEPPSVPAETPRSGTWRAFALGLASGVVLLAAAAGLWWMWRANAVQPAPSRLLAEAWGPMLQRGANITIAVGTPASFFVRDFGDAEPPVGDPVYRLPFRRDAEFEQWYLRSRNTTLGKSVILHPNIHSPLWGDAAASAVISRLFGAYGASVEIAPSARVHPVALRERNAVIIGRGEYTDAARAFAPEDGLVVEYSPEKRAVGIHNRKPGNGEQEWWFATGGLRHNFGLITVLSPDGAETRRTLLLAGINSDGAEAGARVLTTPDKLEELDKRFRQAGLTHWPPRYQAVVRTESLDTYSLETHVQFVRILK